MFLQIQPFLNIRKIHLATGYHEDIWIEWHPGMNLLVEDRTEKSILSLPAKVVEVVGKGPVFGLHPIPDNFKVGNSFGRRFSESLRRHSLSRQMTWRIYWQ